MDDATAAVVKQLQTDGNALYGSGRYEDARARYSDAIALIEAALDAASIRSSDSSDTSLTASHLFSNRAQTFIQERNFAAALHDCTKALKYNAVNEKASVRRLVALENLERFESALALVETVLEDRRAREHTPALFQYAVAARRRLRKALVRDREAAAREADQMGKMVHANQQLRINFGSLVPSRVALGEPFEVVVNIGNEFGLFRRASVTQGERIFLQCSLRSMTTRAPLQLVFHDALDAVDDAPEHASDSAVRPDGRLTLNDRGKVVFRVAVAAAGEGVEKSTETLCAAAALMVTVHEDSRAAWDLFPVVSLPFDVVAPAAAATARSSDSSAAASAAVNDLGVHCCRPVAMAGVDREILLAESPGNLGIGGKLWDSCLVLTRYLALNRALIERKRVVELGSGLGLVGIFCALLGADVTLTDMADVVPLLQYNIALNFPSSSSSSSGESRGVVPTAATHSWGTSTATLPEPNPDVLVLSDVVYDPEGYEPLVASLNALATPDTVVLMAHRSRNPMEHQFFDLLGRTFACELVDWASCFAAHGASAPDASQLSSSSSQGVLQDVKIFRMQRL